MATTYEYTKTPVSLDRLTKEIQDDILITIVLEYCASSGSDLSITFRTALSNNEKTELDTVVTNHSGLPLDIEDLTLVDLGNTAATSTGYSYPEPASTGVAADYNDRTRMSTDSFGNLQVRGPVLTDEGSFRDDFSGTSLFTTLTGTVSFVHDSTTVTGINTLFMSELTSHSYIKLTTDGYDKLVQIRKAESNTQLLLWDAYTGVTATGTAEKSEWCISTDADGTVELENSNVILSSGLAEGSAVINHTMDFPPIKIRGHIRIATLGANQRVCFGLADSANMEPNNRARFVFEGGKLNSVICETSVTTNAVDMEKVTVTLPNKQLITQDNNTYTININLDSVLFYINDILVANHRAHIPGPYEELNCYLTCRNLTVVATEAVAYSNFMHGMNTNELNIASPFLDPKETDGRSVVHATPRRLGTYTYFTGADDDHTDPVKYGGSSNIQDFYGHYTTTGTDTLYADYNTIENETYIREGVMQWKDAINDVVTLEVVPQTTTYTSGSNTYFNLYGGYLIIPAAGNGTIAVSPSDMKLVQCTANEYGVKPAGYWNADWNSSTKVFENVTAAPTGNGNYNMFGVAVTLARFANRIRVLGSSNMRFSTEDITQIGNGMRIKLSIETVGSNHEWWWNLYLSFYRRKTC